MCTFSSKAVVTLLVALFLFSSIAMFGESAIAEPTSDWQETTWNDNRTEACSVQCEDGRLFVFGGFFGTEVSKPTRTAFVIDLVTGVKTGISNMPTGVRGAGAAISPNGKIFVMGGDDGSGSTNLNQIYDINNDSWYLGEVLPYSGWQIEVVYTSIGVVTIGGNSDGAVDFVCVYHEYLGWDDWSSLESLPTPTFGGSAFFISPYVWYVGGLIDAVTPSGKAYRFNTNLYGWEEMNPLPTPLGCSAGVVGPDGLMYVLGGGPNWNAVGDGTSHAFYHSWSNDTWLALPDLNEPMKNSYAFSTDTGWIWVMTGSTAQGSTDHGEGLQVAEVSFEISTERVGQGDSLGFRIGVELRYTEYQELYAFGYLMAPSGTAYSTLGYYSWFAPGPRSIGGLLTIPEGGEVGNWTFFITKLEIVTENYIGHLAIQPKTFEVLESIPLEEQIDNLQSTLTMLQDSMSENDTALIAQIDDMQGQLDALQEAQDESMDTSMLIMGVVLIAVALGVVNIFLTLRKR